jgi:hypothetical protein
MPSTQIAALLFTTFSLLVTFYTVRVQLCILSDMDPCNNTACQITDDLAKPKNIV